MEEGRFFFFLVGEGEAVEVGALRFVEVAGEKVWVEGAVERGLPLGGPVAVVGEDLSLRLEACLVTRVDGFSSKAYCRSAPLKLEMVI